MIPPFPLSTLLGGDSQRSTAGRAVEAGFHIIILFEDPHKGFAIGNLIDARPYRQTGGYWPQASPIPIC